MKQNIGERIRKIRQSKDIKQESVADELGINKSSYSKIENGHTDPTISRLLKIADIFKVDVMDFLTDGKKVEDADSLHYGFATKDEVAELAKMIHALNHEMKNIKELLNKK